MEAIHPSFPVIQLHHHLVLHTLQLALVALTDCLAMRQLPLHTDQLQTQDAKCTILLAVLPPVLVSGTDLCLQGLDSLG